MRLGHLGSALDRLASVSIIIAGGAIVFSLVSARGSRQGVGATGPPVLNVAPDKLEFDPTGIPTLGAAKIMLVEFSDFECPYCSRHSRITFPELKKEFIDKGLLAYSFVNAPSARIHKNARSAAVAAICAHEQGQFWQMREALFGAPGNLQLAPAVLARNMGLQGERFAHCADGAGDVLQRDLETGRRLQVEATPTFFIGVIASPGRVELKRRIDGAVPFEAFRAALNEIIRGDSLNTH